MSAVTESNFGKMPAIRNYVVAAAVQVLAYLIVVLTAFFVVSTGVSPVIPWGVAFVASIAILRVLKRTAVLFFSKKKSRRQGSSSLV